MLPTVGEFKKFCHNLRGETVETSCRNDPSDRFFYRQAQSEFMSLHKEQFDNFVTAQKEDAEMKERETERRIQEIRERIMKEQDEKKEALVSTHEEEVTVLGSPG